MKRLSAIAIAALLLFAALDGGAQAREGALTLVLAGGAGADTIAINLSADGGHYEVASASPLEVRWRHLHAPRGQSRPAVLRDRRDRRLRSQRRRR